MTIDWLREWLGPGPTVRAQCADVVRRLDESLSNDDRLPLDLTDPHAIAREFRPVDFIPRPLTPNDIRQMIQRLQHIGRALLLLGSVLTGCASVTGPPIPSVPQLVQDYHRTACIISNATGPPLNLVFMCTYGIYIVSLVDEAKPEGDLWVTRLEDGRRRKSTLDDLPSSWRKDTR